MTRLALFWTLWCALHSLLISNQARQLANRLTRGRDYGLYRLGYVIFSVFSLVPLIWYQMSLPRQTIIPTNTLVFAIQAVLLIYASAMFYLGGRIYDMGYFLGLSQWRNARNSRPEPSLPFRANGVLAHVRHPWYSGGIALLWGLGPLNDIHLLTATLLSCYFIIGTLLEEKRLKTELGKPYEEYCRRVPMLLPWKRAGSLPDATPGAMMDAQKRSEQELDADQPPV